MVRSEVRVDSYNLAEIGDWKNKLNDLSEENTKLKMLITEFKNRFMA